MSILLSVELSSQAPTNGTLVRWFDNTRSITTFSGQGRNTVNVASSNIAIVALASWNLNGLRNANTFGDVLTAERSRRSAVFGLPMSVTWNAANKGNSRYAYARVGAHSVQA